MIIYPELKDGAKIGVTAPSSGVEQELHGLVKQAAARLEAQGFSVETGDTVWTQEKAKSAPAQVRAEEFNRMMDNDEIGLIFPPWGGELLIEILEYINFANLKGKWVLGYSDVSALLLAITLKTGIATAHGTNLVDLRGGYSDPTTNMWKTVLRTRKGESVLQQSSKRYQKEWQHTNPSSSVFHLTEETVWKTPGNRTFKAEGRLLGGCMDIIRHLIGTPYGNVRAFREKYIKGEPLIWYLENCEMSTTDLKRTLVQMKLAGWFDNCAGILFGRNGVDKPVQGYTYEDVYNELEDLQIPIVYDIDCGHVPPQITFINGAYAQVIGEDGKGLDSAGFCLTAAYNLQYP